ncbi:hypothetical protein Sa4125_05840 [Aureimonas sp. SA4125]|uniref:tetratricopeptide repeat protein n=1 Tax=Aureimonas sp. SA4125 TaxID=2826993 RepID=UPI001CC36A8E|nr:tetratricopeptide repeat protein [Aureimonas sp. SA4125]BDA83042.1 hypothetical protein Sa4125_05840 [Aureimonas sp. SA4125]
MSDESFFREVNEEIRQDRTRQIWARYGRVIMALAVLAVLVTAGYVAWREYSIGQANESGDRYLAALDLAATGDPTEASAALDQLSEDGYGAYRDLARMRAATLKESQGADADAVAAFDAVAGDAAAPKPIRDMAAIRAAYILVDAGSLDDVSQRVVQLSGEDQPLRYPAREALGLAAWKAGNFDDAKRYFEQLRDDQGTPSGIAVRTRLLLELIAAGTRPVAVDAAASAPEAPAAAAPVEPAAPAAGAPAETTAPAEIGAPAASPTPVVPSAPAAPAAPAAETSPPAADLAPAPPAEPAAAPAEPAAPVAGETNPAAPATEAAPEAATPTAPAAPGTTAPAN